MDDTKLANLIIRHTLVSEGYGKQLADKIVRLLNSADAELMDKIAARYSAIETKGFDAGPAATKRLEDMLDGIRAINSNVYSKLATTATDDLNDIANHEVDFTTKAMKSSGFTVDKSTTIPDANFIKTLVETTPIPVDQNGVALLKPWVDGLEDGRMKRLESTIRLGLFQGETTDDLVKRIRGTKAAGYLDGILNISRQSAQTFALTANASVQNNARLETFKGMRSIRFLEWSSILDGRTSSICQSLSGKIFAIDAPHPTPPAHPRCRSLLLPRRNDTDPPKHKPYREWLKEQGDDVQDDVLGKGRGEAFRNGTIKADDLYRNDGSFTTLEELKAHDAKIVETTNRSTK